MTILLTAIIFTVGVIVFSEYNRTKRKTLTKQSNIKARSVKTGNTVTSGGTKASSGMVSFSINGNNYTSKGKDISISSDGIYIDGKKFDIEDFASKKNITVKIESPVQNLKVTGDVECHDVLGNVDAGMSVNCGNVSGKVDAGMSVNCGDVQGEVYAGMNVTCCQRKN